MWWRIVILEVMVLIAIYLRSILEELR